MLYIGLGLVAALQIWTLWLLGAGRKSRRGGRRKTAGRRHERSRNVGPAREGESLSIPAGEEVTGQMPPKKDGQEPDPYERAFRDGVSSILNYDMAAARKAVQRDG